MASILNKQTSYNISNVVANGIKTIKEIRSNEQARTESEFQKAVASGLSYADQIKFREKQLSDAQSAGFVDEQYIRDLEKTIATTRQLARFQGIRERYKKSLDDYTTGKGSLDSYINTLESTLDGESDPTMRNELMGLIQQAHAEKAQNDLNAIKNRATIAQKDKSLSLVNSSIDEIKSKKALAAINKNDEEVSMWDETLLALNGVKSKLQIENSLNEISFKIARNNPKANDKLSYLNDEIAKATSEGSITYDGVTYPSLKAYWEAKRDEYIATNYFDEVKKELDAETAKIAATSKFGQTPAVRIQAVSDFYNTIKTRPEFVNYSDQIEQRRVSEVSKLTNDLAESLYNEADSTGNITAAQNAILGLEKKFGVSVSREPFKGEGSIATEVGKKAPTSVVEPIAITTPGEHTVSSGETLTSIAEKNNISLLQLLDSNPEYKKNPNSIKVGSIVKLPTQTPQTNTETKPVVNAPVAPTKPATNTTTTPVKPTDTTTAPINAPQTMPAQNTVTQPSPVEPVKKKNYQSVVDLLNDKKMDSSYANRKKLAQQYGIQNYTGSADQNIELIKKINV